MVAGTGIRTGVAAPGKMKNRVLTALLGFSSLVFATGALALPLCSKFDSSVITDEQIEQVVGAVFAAHPLPWTYEFAALIMESAQALGCEPDNYLEQLLPLFEDGFEPPPGALLSTEGVDSPSTLLGCGGLGFATCYKKRCSCYSLGKEVYCPCLSYCGDGDSSTEGVAPQIQDLTLLRASDELNLLCYAHDRCYGRSCQQGVGCVFNTQNEAIVECDAPMDEYCLGSGRPIIDRIICRASKLLRASSNLFNCESPNTDSSYCPVGSMCLTESETCSVPPSTGYQGNIDLTGPAAITGSACTGTMTISGTLTANLGGNPTLTFAGTETINLSCYSQSIEVQATVPLTVSGTLISGSVVQPFTCAPPCVSGQSTWEAALQLNRFFLGQHLIGTFKHTNENQTPFSALSVGEVNLSEQP